MHAYSDSGVVILGPLIRSLLIQSEAYSDPVKRRRQERLTEAKSNLSKAFVPSSGSKKPYVKLVITYCLSSVSFFCGLPQNTKNCTH